MIGINLAAGDTVMHSLPESQAGSPGVQRALTWGIFLAAAGIVAYLCLAILRPFANVIAWSAVLAILCYPLQQRLVRRTGRVTLSAFVTSALTVLALVVPLLLLGSIAVNQGVAVGRWLQGALQTRAETMARASGALAQFTASVGFGETEISAWIQGHASDVSRGAEQYAVTLATGLVDGVVSSLFVIFAMFLLLRDGDRVVGAIPDLMPFERERSEALLRRIRDVVHASVYSVVVIGILQGLLCGVVFWILGIPSAALWGAVTMFASVLPVVGAFAVWGPGTAYLALTGAWPQAIILALWGTFVVSGIDNVLRPRLVAGRVGLSELSMFFALLGGLSVFGGLGVILGPVAFATIAAIVRTLREPAP
jgi:predicted PurR-regulated permease PerM